MKIGEIAKASGVGIDTLRYYEKEGLIRPSHRSDSGYRHYDQQAVQQMQFILRAKALGFSLQEIRDLLSLRIDREHQPCSSVKEKAQTKLTQIESKIAELQRIHKVLQQITDQCCGGSEPAVHCSILDALEHPL
ncbi:MAG TPA: Zn(2+)-responsive transcriptional regulator [Dongiaceae bacterium]|nr:Zn(2+)-responsive transcriptional regulator [Dongiaceae bacterium]